MAQRPKFKVHKYGMGRKTSLIAILQKLKPCLFAQCVSLLGDKREEDHSQEDERLSLNGMATGAQEPAKTHMTVKFDPAKSIWQYQVKQGPQRHLTTMQDVKRTPKELTANAKQLQKKPNFKYIENNLIFLPLQHFIMHKLRESLQFNGRDETSKQLIVYEHPKVRPQVAVILPEPRFSRFIEFDLSSNPMAKEILKLFFCSHSKLGHNDPKAIIVLSILKDLMTIDANNRPGRKSVNYLETLSSARLLRDVFPPIWGSKQIFPNRFMKIVITYFVVFCVVALLFSIFV